MERNIVTGKGETRRRGEEEKGRQGKTFVFRDPRPSIRDQKGFSLLELMIAMFIMIILLSIAVPTYQRSVLQAKEVVLKENLWQMRRAIDQFTADKGKMPQSIDELVSEKYLREKPIDPIRQETDWQEEQGEDPHSTEAASGLKNVHSLAEGEGTDGVPYSQY